MELFWDIFLTEKKEILSERTGSHFWGCSETVKVLVFVGKRCFNYEGIGNYAAIDISDHG